MAMEGATATRQRWNVKCDDEDDGRRDEDDDGDGVGDGDGDGDGDSQMTESHNTAINAHVHFLALSNTAGQLPTRQCFTH